MRTAGRLLLLLSIAWATSWAAPVRATGQEGAPVRLLSPRPDVTLIAGSTAELEWAPLAPFLDLSEVEEWEAFLSLDGGATYPVRITPHLDQDLRRVRWEVPDLPTPQAAILLRFGDERRETAVELPVRFAIVASSVPSAEQDVLALARRVRAPGEPALPGQAGVVAWVEGSRRGGSARQVVAAEPLDGIRAGFEPRMAHAAVAEAASEPLPSGALGRVPAKNASFTFPAGRRAALARAGTAPSLPSNILLLIQRQNE
jgi:hypothetical protein